MDILLEKNACVRKLAFLRKPIFPDNYSELDNID